LVGGFKNVTIIAGQHRHLRVSARDSEQKVRRRGSDLGFFHLSAADTCYFINAICDEGIIAYYHEV
jgi:hypothetical protein